MLKNTFLKTIGATLVILILAIFAQISALAQDKNDGQQNEERTQKNLSEQSGGRIVGTWDVQVTIRNCQKGAAIRSVQVISTVMSGGTLLVSDSQAFRTPAHGVWSHLGGNSYRFKTKSFSFDVAGNFTGWAIISQEVHLNRHADESESSGTAEIYAPNGILVFTVCSSTTATRFE